MFQPLIWKTHKRREQFNECPHCGKPLKWIYDGLVWYPCDKEPILFMLHPQGQRELLYNRNLISNCLLYTRGDKRFEGIKPFSGSMQHYHTCPVLREHRRQYMIHMNGGIY